MLIKNILPIVGLCYLLVEDIMFSEATEAVLTSLH